MNIAVIRIVLILLFSALSFQACAAEDIVAPMQASARKALPLQTKQDLLQEAIAAQIYIHGGSYMMGTDDKRYMDGFTGDNIYPHKVTLTSFYFPKYLISANQLNSYLILIGKDDLAKKNREEINKGAIPAEGNWQQAHDYCAWLAEQTNLPFALPTEAQWEYVARNEGKDDAYPTPNGLLELGKNYPDKENFIYKLEKPGLFGDHSGNQLLVNSPPVNKIGIHQMGGNVSEWMNDWYAQDYYWHSPEKDPQGPATDNGNMGDLAPLKVARGISSGTIGSGYEWKKSAASYHRLHDPVTEDLIGFRCVINSDKPMAELKAEMKKKRQCE